jgi:hypothetical protein
VKMSELIFWIVLSSRCCSYQYFSIWRWWQYVSLKHWYLSASPHGITAQETNIDSGADNSMATHFAIELLAHCSDLTPHDFYLSTAAC